VIHEVGIKAGGADLILGEIAGQLVDDGAHHFQMAQLLGADVRQQCLQLRVGHGVPLAQIAQGGAQLAVGAAVLADDDRCQLWVGSRDLHRVLQFLFIDKHQSFPPSSQGQGSFTQAKPSSGVGTVICRGPYSF